MRPLLLLVAVLALAAPAAAAPPWSVPQQLGDTAVDAASPRLVVSGDGTALAWWRSGAGLALASRPPGRAAFGTTRTVPADVVYGAVAYGRSRAALLLSSSTGVDAEAVSVSLGTARGSFGRPARIVSGQIRRPALAGNASGDLAVAWFEDRGTANDRVYVRLRRRGRGFGRAIRLAQGRIRNVSVAVGPRGDVLVAWDARGTIRARMRRAGRRSFDRVDTIRSEDAYFASLRPAVLGNGRAIVAWSAQFLSEGGDRGPRFDQVAVRPANLRRFRPAQLLERNASGSIQQGNLVLAASPGGPPFVAWTGAAGVRVSFSDRSGVFGEPQTVAPAPNVLVDALRSPLGDAVVAWTADIEAPQSALFTAVAPSPPGTLFGPPEMVSGSVDAREAVLGASPVDGRITALWSDRTAAGRGVFAADRERGPY